jgi:hypothetical protein
MPILRVFSLATQPERQANLKTIIPILLAQADVLHIHWVGYGADRPTEFNDPKIMHHEWESAGSEIRLFPYNLYPKAYFFSVDDDILYPSNYADTLIQAMQLYRNRVVCCVHASNIKLQQEQHFFTNHRQIVHFTEALQRNRRMMLPGVGTSCFYTPYVNINRAQFTTNNMSDTYTACFLAKQHIPVIAIQREVSWLQPMPEFNVRIFGNNPYNVIDREINRHRWYFIFNRYWFKLRYRF